VLTLPNFLTLLRIVAIPVFLAILAQGNYAAAFVVLVCAGITDVADGCIARINESTSELGAVLDPMADKLLLLSSFLVLGIAGHLPAWLVAFVVMRDVILVVGYVAIFVVDQEWVEIAPSRTGKMTTFVQLFTIGFALVGQARPDLPLVWFNYAMQCLTALATAASGIQYVYRGLLWHQRHGNVLS
jgi:cardiolipin synthase